MSYYAVLLKDCPDKKIKENERSNPCNHANLFLINIRIEGVLHNSVKVTKKGKRIMNDLRVSKVVKIIHFVAQHNLAIKQLYPDHLYGQENQEPFIEQCHMKAVKNSGGCDSFLS